MTDFTEQADWLQDNYASGTADLTDYRIQLDIDRGLDPETGQIQVGTMQIRLNNASGRFSKHYASSPLYPNVQVGRAARARRANTGGTAVPLFTGFIREPSVETVLPDFFATLDCVDLIDNLRRTKISTPLYEGYRSDQLIAAILALTGYTGGSAYETGAKTFAYASWRKTPALEAIQQVINSEMGQFYIDARGTPTFHARYHRVTTTTDELSLSNNMAGFRFLNSADDIYNEAQVTCYPRAVGGTAVLWSWNEAPVYIPAGGTVTLEAEFTDPTYARECEGKSIVTPAGTTDYLANSLSDGSGTDLTSSVGGTVTAYGQYADVTIVNGGTVGMYITQYQLRGLPVTKLDPVTATEQNAASIAAYDMTNTITLDQPLETSVESARDAAAYLAQIYGEPRDRIRFSLQPADDTRKNALVNLELDDRIAVTETLSGLSADSFFIDRIAHSIGEHDNSHVATYEASGADTFDLIILDSGSQTFSDLLGY